ncbi:MAG: N-succinylarginine dihydrolase [Myxococcaceae bacterium]
MREYNFDGLVGPTHNYGGLAFGNTASARHQGRESNPRQAALEGLAKMRFIDSVGVGQAVLPPHPRPSLSALRALGFHGSDAEVLARAAVDAEHLLRQCSSAAAMWTANAATVAPSTDAQDAKVHFTPANLQAMFHRAIEADTTWRVLSAIFSDTRHFVVHRPLPGGSQFADEGAANHTRLFASRGAAAHIFAWGRSAFQGFPAPSRYPARQTLEASQALARLHRLDPARCLFPQQAPVGIDAGAFHTDVLAVGNGPFFMLHALAFLDPQGLLHRLRDLVGGDFSFALADAAELPVERAVAAYPFNSQLVTLPSGKMAIVAPKDSEADPHCRGFLNRVLHEDNPVEAVHYLDVRQSMDNGGGPACLRLRVALTDAERASVSANVFYTAALHAELEAWVRKHYRDRLVPEDFKDPLFARETFTALDVLCQILRLGSVFDFQR